MIHGERFPEFQEDNEEHLDESDEVYIGFLKFDCSKTTQHGYLSVLKAPYHGGPLAGRIFRITAQNFGVDQFGPLDTEMNGTVPLKAYELAAFVENRGYGNRYKDAIRLSFILIPSLVTCP